jgi:hypothetical protein
MTESPTTFLEDKPLILQLNDMYNDFCLPDSTGVEPLPFNRTIDNTSFEDLSSLKNFFQGVLLGLDTNDIPDELKNVSSNCDFISKTLRYLSTDGKEEVSQNFINLGHGTVNQNLDILEQFGITSLMLKNIGETAQVSDQRAFQQAISNFTSAAEIKAKEFNISGAGTTVFSLISALLIYQNEKRISSSGSLKSVVDQSVSNTKNQIQNEIKRWLSETATAHHLPQNATSEDIALYFKKPYKNFAETYVKSKGNLINENEYNTLKGGQSFV